MVTTAGNTGATGDTMAGRCCSGTGTTGMSGMIIQTGVTIMAGTSRDAERRMTRDTGGKMIRETGVEIMTEAVNGRIMGGATIMVAVMAMAMDSMEIDLAGRRKSPVIQYHG